MLYSSLLNGLSTRRQALRSMLSLGTLAAAGTASLAACAAPEQPPRAGRRQPIDFNDPAQSLRAFLKLTGDLDPSVETLGWFGGDVFAVLGPDQPLKKLMGIQGFGVLRVSPQGDNVYRVFNRELALYTHPETGKFIDTWTNPFTGEEVEVFPIQNMIVNAEVAPVSRMDFDGTIVEIPFTAPWSIQRDNVLSLFELHTVVPNPMKPEAWPRESAGPVLRISEIFQRNGKLAELEDPDRSWADYTGTWTRIGPWMPWMMQGQAPGYLLYRTFMDRTGTAENLPPALRARAERDYPEYFQAPGDETWGMPNDSSFGVFMERNEPRPAPGEDQG
ncbi:MAG: DUF1838 family protein [Chromatiales bacterium]|nr:DUF1838 family protein [Chromatiales bacterium]